MIECMIDHIPRTVVVPNGATRDAGAKPKAEKLPTSPSTMRVNPNHHNGRLV